MLLDDLRKKIDSIDEEMIELIGKRIDIVREIARLKKQSQMPVLDRAREEEIRDVARILAKKRGLSSAVIEELMEQILDYSRMEMGAV